MQFPGSRDNLGADLRVRLTPCRWRSLRKISAALVAQGHLTARGKPYRRGRSSGHAWNVTQTACKKLGLEERGIPAAWGGKWSAVQVARLPQAGGRLFEGASGDAV